VKAGIVKYVKIMKRLTRIVSILLIVALMVFLVFAFNRVAGTAFIWAAVAAGVLLFVLYGFYEWKFSMGAVLEVTFSDQCVYLKTQRKTYTYDLVGGCVDMKVTKRKFVGTFETQDSSDSFVFYRHVPFTPYGEEQFTYGDMRRFYPKIDDIDEE